MIGERRPWLLIVAMLTCLGLMPRELMAQSIALHMPIDGVIRATVTDDGNKKCVLDPNSASADFSATDLQREWHVGELGKSSEPKPLAIQRLIRGEPIYCSDQAPWSSVTATTFTLGAALSAQEPATRNDKERFEISWYGWDSPDLQNFLHTPLRGDVTCNFKNRDAVVGNCTFQQLLGPNGGRRFVFTSGTELATVTDIEVTFGNPKTNGLTIRVAGCEYHPTAPVRRLYKDAVRQVLHLTSDTGCLERIKTSRRVTLESGDHRVEATVPEAGGNPASAGVELLVEQVPAGLGVQRHLFNLTSDGAFIGTARIEVRASGIAATTDAAGHPRLAISFDEKEALDQLHSQESVDGIAVTSFADDGKAGRRAAGGELYVHNTLELKPEDDLHDAAAAIGAGRNREPYDDTDFAWQIRSLSAPAAWLHYATPEGKWWDENAGYDELSRLTFAVFAASPSALTVAVDLVDINAPGRKVLYSTAVRIANQARPESLPLQVQDLLYVVCGDDSASLLDPTLLSHRAGGLDVVAHGQTRAIEDADITTGQCKLVYDQERLIHLTGYAQRSEGRRALRYFRLQDVHVTLSRAGQSAGERTWSIDPTRRETLTLPYSDVLAKQTGPYTVRATLNGQRPPEVVYRPQRGASIKPVTADRALGGLEFVAGLRPRGNQGWTAAPIRTFVTIPIDVFGYRLPSNPRQLKTSSDSPHIQGVTLKAGIALVIEPWNYHTGSNPLPIPLRLLSGFHLFDLTDEQSAPSFVTGLSAAFPILELPDGAVQNQLGTDLTVTGYWEMSLEQDIGHHFLVAFGANFLSLFGSK